MVNFDVFLCHNSQDKSEVRKIALQLRQRGLKPWLDEWYLRPGFSWQQELENQIHNIHSTAVFVGNSGVGPWQNMEIGAYLRRFVNQGLPVIPVLLLTAPQEPKLPFFLEGMTWVDFRDSKSNPMRRLIWGITGIQPHVQEVDHEKVEEATINSDEVKFRSEKGVDYTKLRDFLKQHKWKEADQETGKVMCQAAERKKEGWLNEQDMDNIPYKDFCTINQLWLHYSKGKFGFSAQKKIYQSLGGTKNYNHKVWKNFCDHIGWSANGNWLNYSDLTFKLELAPNAHLPSLFGLCAMKNFNSYNEIQDFHTWSAPGFSFYHRYSAVYVERLLFSRPRAEVFL